MTDRVPRPGREPGRPPRGDRRGRSTRWTRRACASPRARRCTRPTPWPPIRSRTYLNAAARVETALTARALLAACLDVERALGRVRPPGRPAAARTIDVDLLLHGDAVIDEPPDLVVPHPRLLERAFVRIPLADVALPGLVHPVTREPLDRAAPAPSVRRLPGA